MAFFFFLPAQVSYFCLSKAFCKSCLFSPKTTLLIKETMIDEGIVLWESNARQVFWGRKKGWLAMVDIRRHLNKILSPVQSPITESPLKALRPLITLCVSPGEPSANLVNTATEWKGWWVYSWKSIPQPLQMGSLCLNMFPRGKREGFFFSPHHFKCFCTSLFKNCCLGFEPMTC